MAASDRHTRDAGSAFEHIDAVLGWERTEIRFFQINVNSKLKAAEAIVCESGASRLHNVYLQNLTVSQVSSEKKEQNEIK